MKTIFYNDDNLKSSEISETVIRVKAILLNQQNEIIIGYCDKSYQFPGGHLEQNETLESALIREISEETGIQLKMVPKPALCIKHYTKNYRNTNKNRENIIYYYQISTNELPNYQKRNLDEYEKEKNYQLQIVNIKELKKLLQKTINDNPINKLLYKEIFEVIDKLNLK